MAGGNEALAAASGVTKTIPIVFVIGDDPVKLGYVQSLSRPGGNVTGVLGVSTKLVPKKLELLEAVVRNPGKFGYLRNERDKGGGDEADTVQSAVQSQGQSLVVVNAGTDGDFEKAFVTLSERGVRALLVGSGAYFRSHRDQIATLALRYDMPAIFDQRDYVVAGGLMSYGPSFTDTYRLAGNYVGRILAGENPSVLPVLQPTKFELIINVGTAERFWARAANSGVGTNRRTH
jgi:putative ABC transport system substrate-binding protein